MSRKKFLFSILAVAMSLVCGSLLSSDTYAAQSFIREINTNNSETWSFCPSRTTFVRTTNYTCSISSDFTRQFIPLNNILSGDIDLNAGDRVIMYYSHTFKNNTANSNQRNLQTISGQGFPAWFDIENITIEEVGKEENFDQKSYIYIYTGRANQNISINSYQLSGAPFRFTAFAGQNFTYYYQGVFFYGEDADADFKNSITSYLSDISSDTSDIVDILSDIYSDTSSINRNLQSIVDAQEQANQDANDRYEDEKDTIDTNTSGGIDAVDDIDTTINLPNPLSFFLGSLSVNTCYDISTLASMVGSSTTTYCSWFSSSTRTIMTPFVDVFVFVIVSAFIWSWVKKGGL